MYERVLVPLDGSRFASKALESAYEIAERFDSEIIIVRVVKPAIPVAVTGGTFTSAETPQSARISVEVALADEKRRIDRARKYLARKARTGKCSNMKCTYLVVTGHPAERIIKLARDEKVDLIVMSTHGTGGLKRAILGSVADEVIRKSRKTVLVVHPESGRS